MQPAALKLTVQLAYGKTGTKFQHTLNCIQ